VNEHKDSYFDGSDEFARLTLKILTIV